MDQPYPYRYRALIGNELRLLKISNVRNRMIGSLVHHDLTDSPSFHALSYVWGTEVPSELIECEGHYLAVTPHLLDGLAVLERQFGGEWFWIDAVCVNQQDDAEKAIQVPRMTEIYSSAEKVIIWLGPAYDGSDMVMESIPTLNKLFTKVEDLAKVTRDTLITYGLPSIENPFWLAIFKLAYRDWFSRLWVVQEAVLAQSIVLLCGEMQLDFREMVSFINHLRSSLIMDDVILEHNFRLPTTDSGLSALPLIERFREMRSDGGDIHLYSLLQLSNRKNVKENVDKVYGMMGIMSRDLQAKIKVDYLPESKQKFWQLYIDICKISLEDDGFVVLFMAPSEQKRPELPSWCPDLRYDSDVNALYTTYCAGIADQDFDESNIPKPMVRIPDSNNVEFRGLEMDKIKDLIELCPNALGHIVHSPQKAKLVLECEARCLELSKEVLGSDDPIPTQHIGTLITGMHPDRSFYYVAQAVEDYHCMRALLQKVSQRDYNTGPLLEDHQKILSAQRYLGAMTIAWRGSSFFTTEGGRIGIGPKSMKTGDLICIFFGAHVPHILRFDSAFDIYLFVGSAFVSGLMSGVEFYTKDPTHTYMSFVVG